MSNNDELLSKIFEMVNTKAEAKPKKKRKPMTPEQRERCLANLKKGRETSLRKRQAKKGAEKTKQPTIAPPPPVAPPPLPTPVEKHEPVEKPPEPTSA